MSAATLSGKGKNDNLSSRNRGRGCDYEILNDPVLGTLYLEMTLARGSLARGLFMLVHLFRALPWSVLRNDPAAAFLGLCPWF